MTTSKLANRSGSPRPKRKAPVRKNRPELHQLADAIRGARVHHGLTQSDLAGLSGTGERFIVELEQGKQTLQLGKVLDVIATLGLRLSVDGPGAKAQNSQGTEERNR